MTDSTALARAAGFALGLSAAAVATVVFIRLIRRFRAASPPLRRVIGPVYFFTLIALIGLVTSNLAWTFDENAGLAIEIAALAALALMPVAFLAGILRTRLQRAGIADLVIALGNGQPLRDALADALGDPSLGLAYWSSQRQAWVDEEGRTMTEPIARGAHAATFVENDGKRVAALLHDRSLADQRPLVDAVAATAGLAFEKERLQAELRAQYRFLETIIDTAPSLLSVVDTEGRIRNFNHAVEVASGLQGRALVEGRYFWEVFIDPAEREAMIQRFRDASPAFPASAYENVFTNALGEERVIAWQTAPLVDENGDVVRIVAGRNRHHRPQASRARAAAPVGLRDDGRGHDPELHRHHGPRRAWSRGRARTGPSATCSGAPRRSSRVRRSSTSSRARTSSPRAWRSPVRQTACRRPSASRAG